MSLEPESDRRDGDGFCTQQRSAGEGVEVAKFGTSRSRRGIASQATSSTVGSDLSEGPSTRGVADALWSHQAKPLDEILEGGVLARREGVGTEMHDIVPDLTNFVKRCNEHLPVERPGEL